MMAFVRNVIADSIRLGSKLSFSDSISMKTGVAHSWRTAFATATKANEGIITSSPSQIPSARRHKCRALVPELTATASEAPTCAAIACSNSSSLGPRLNLEVRSTSLTALISSSFTSGADRGILIVASRREHVQRKECAAIDALAAVPSKEAHWLALERSALKHDRPRRGSPCLRGTVESEVIVHFLWQPRWIQR